LRWRSPWRSPFDRSSGLNRLQIRIIQNRELVYNETISPEKPGK
jgi:hypothetical protein